MSIKLVTMFSTERVVGDLYEVRYRHMPEAVIGYLICKPQIISMTKSLPSQGLDQSNEPEYRVAFTPWNPFSKHDIVRLNTSAIINITDAREDIEKIYRDELEKSVDQMVVIAQNPFAGDHERAKKQPMGESIKEDVGISTYLGGIVQSMRKAGLIPKTAKQMKHGFSKSRDKIGFFIDVEQRGFDKKEMYTLQVEIDRDGNLWYLSGHRPMKLGKWADTSKIVRMWKALNKARGFGQDAIFKKR